MQPNQSNQPNQLRPYQIEGVEKLIGLAGRRGGAILADEPGLGKTAQTAEFINRTNPKSVLIVCPASLRVNWRKELDRWLNPDTLCRVKILSYESVSRGDACDDSCDLAVFDEAHYLKNPQAKRTKACLSLRAGTRLFLTGTPVVNRPMDLFPILKSLGLKLTKTDFGKRYCAGHLRQISWKPRKFAWDFSGASHQDELNAVLRGQCMVRRTKDEVLAELPAKIRQIVELDIPGYRESASLRDAVSRMFDGMASAAENLPELKSIAFKELAAARLDIARQKLPVVLDFLRDLLEEEEKVVVFAHHREIISAIAAAVSRSVELKGGMTDVQKDAAVRAFQEGSARLFVGQITAAGTGITLTVARTVVFTELDWVPGNVIQAEDRCHRIGQQLPVRVIHLVAGGSVDARMVHALVEKQENFERVMR